MIGQLNIDFEANIHVGRQGIAHSTTKSKMRISCRASSNGEVLRGDGRQGWRWRSVIGWWLFGVACFVVLLIGPTVLGWRPNVMTLICRKLVCKHVSREALWGFSSSHDFSPLRATERGPWRLFGKLSHSSLGFQSPSMVFFPFWGWWERGFTNWRCWCEGEVQLEHGTTVKNLGKGLTSSLWFPFFSLSLLFVNP